MSLTDALSTTTSTRYSSTSPDASTSTSSNASTNTSILDKRPPKDFLSDFGLPIGAFSSDTLAAALNGPIPRFSRTSPPPHYNPYPYNRSWQIEFVHEKREQAIYNNREDTWAKVSGGEWNYKLRRRIYSTWTAGIRDRQFAAKRKLEDQELREKEPPVPMRGTPPPELEHVEVTPEDLVDHRFDLEFSTVAGEKGCPMRTLLSGRRAIANTMDSAKGKVFQKYYQDNIWVRIKWPAYPEHEPVRSIMVTFRCSGKSNRRRPCSRLELSIALASLVTRFYEEVSTKTPVLPHLALGMGPGQLSMYDLRMMELKASLNGIYDLLLELDVPEPDPEGVPGADVEVKEEEVRIIEPSWPTYMPVQCIIAPPPKVTVDQYFAHVDPITMSHRYLPTWQEQ